MRSSQTEIAWAYCQPFPYFRKVKIFLRNAYIKSKGKVCGVTRMAPSQKEKGMKEEKETNKPNKLLNLKSMMKTTNNF